jgi:periplasmic protein CpxP/Spy
MTKFTGKNLKRTAAVLLCSVSLVLPALAQTGTTDGAPPAGQQQGPPPGGGRRGGGPEQRLERMTKELNLSADQQTKIKVILDDGRAKMMAARDPNASQDDQRAKMMELRKAESLNIKAVLDDSQKAKFDDMEKRERERMRDGGGRGPGGPGGPPPTPPASPQA